MARKGQKFKTWIAEEKYKIIKSIIEMKISLSEVGKQNSINNSMLHRMGKKYKKDRIKGLENKKLYINSIVNFISLILFIMQSKYICWKTMLLFF